MTSIKHVQDEPYDRGDSDAYYGRPAVPHRRLMIDGKYFKSYALTPEEREAYYKGFEDNPSDRKDWR